MSTTSVEDAILASHRKDSEVRLACAVYDRILLDVRQEYQFPVEPEQWAVGLAKRLEFLNKDYRRTVRTNTQTLGTRLRNLYGRRATACLGTTAPATQEPSTVQGLSVVLVSKPSLAEPRVGEQEANLMCDLLTRVDVALQLCTNVENLIPKITRLYEAHGDTLPLLGRVLLRRSMSRLQRGLGEAVTCKQQIQRAMEEWRHYFEVLTSETALTRLLDEVHAQKLSTKVFLNEVTPVVDRFRALREKRDDIMNKSTALSFAHETNWLPGSVGLPDCLVADELSKYNSLLEDAKQQRVPHEEILHSLEEFKDRSMSPKVVIGPGGVDIDLSRLAPAYVEFRQIHFTCNAVTRLAKPLLKAVEGDIKTLSEREQDEDAKAIRG